MRALIFSVCFVLCATQSVHDLNKDLQPEATQRRVHEIIQDHENYKYGGHGGHEYEDELPQKGRRTAYPETSYPHPVAVKKGLGYKGHNYYVALPPKSSRRYEKLEPINSKIYAYYPKSGSDERSDHPVIYYPTKEDSAENSAEYTPDGYPATNKIYVVPEHHKHSKYITAPPHRHQYQIQYVAPKIHADQGHEYGSNHEKSAHHDLGHHAHHHDHGEHKEQDHGTHKDYEVSGHKSHAAKAGHHDSHSKYHNKGSYERDRGYHYEKAYAYDKIRAHHDVGKSHDSHSDYKAHHGQENHHKKGNQGSHSYMYFKKADRHGGHGYGKHGHIANKHGQYKKSHDYHGHASLPVQGISHYQTIHHH